MSVDENINTPKNIKWIEENAKVIFTVNENEVSETTELYITNADNEISIDLSKRNSIRFMFKKYEYVRIGKNEWHIINIFEIKDYDTEFEKKYSLTNDLLKLIDALREAKIKFYFDSYFIPDYIHPKIIYSSKKGN